LQKQFAGFATFAIFGLILHGHSWIQSRHFSGSVACGYFPGDSGPGSQEDQPILLMYFIFSILLIFKSLTLI
jgi:hypothetical protein